MQGVRPISPPVKKYLEEIIYQNFLKTNVLQGQSSISSQKKKKAAAKLLEFLILTGEVLLG